MLKQSAYCSVKCPYICKISSGCSRTVAGSQRSHVWSSYAPFNPVIFVERRSFSPCQNNRPRDMRDPYHNHRCNDSHSCNERVMMTLATRNQTVAEAESPQSRAAMTSKCPQESTSPAPDNQNAGRFISTFRAGQAYQKRSTWRSGAS